MQVSRLTFTKETKDKMSKPLNRRERGELRWKKLKELDESGKLSSARVRTDITKMMGLGDGYGAGYSWVSNMIRRGHLKETIYGTDKNGRVEFEYHVVGEPDYRSKNAVAGRKAWLEKRKNMTGEIGMTKEYTVTNEYTLPKPVVTVEGNTTLKAIIRYGELSIELEGIDVSIIERIIDKLANK